eukprot:2249732-Rhodomonas_salina.1
MRRNGQLPPPACAAAASLPPSSSSPPPPPAPPKLSLSSFHRTARVTITHSTAIPDIKPS